MNLQLTGRLALVSGSTAGIGHAIAQALAAEGARVIVNGRSQASVDAAVAQIEPADGGEVIGFAGDLSTAAAAEALVARHPGIEILVNNLGIFEPKPFEEIPDADWTRFFDVNVLSGVRLARLVLPAMRRADWGRIIFISSESAIQIPAEMIHAGMTKTAQLAVSRGLAEAVAGTGITVNSVLPGPTLSEGVQEMVAPGESAEVALERANAFVRQHRASSILQRVALPEEVANMVVYVCSPQASATTGAALRVDGGTADTI
jgi:NAD(P)-dependent dehydrogenase (short-subunit alcohol dehydrogenase family)